MGIRIIDKIVISIFILSIILIVSISAISNPENKNNNIIKTVNTTSENDENEQQNTTSSSYTLNRKTTSSKSKRKSSTKSSSYKTTSSKSTSSKKTSSPSKSSSKVQITENTKLNINTVTVEQLTAIDSIGTKIAQAIIDFRNNIGRFDSIEELQMVPGVGTKRYEVLSQYLYCE